MEKLNFTIEETYEGPLDLLLALIKKNEMSIFDIQIHVIFRQYMEYLEKMKELDKAKGKCSMLKQLHEKKKKIYKKTEKVQYSNKEFQ